MHKLSFLQICCYFSLLFASVDKIFFLPSLYYCFLNYLTNIVIPFLLLWDMFAQTFMKMEKTGQGRKLKQKKHKKTKENKTNDISRSYWLVPIFCNLEFSLFFFFLLLPPTPSLSSSNNGYIEEYSPRGRIIES